MTQNQSTSEVVHYRRRMKFNQFQVAILLGWKNTKGLRLIESGSALPTLITALKLSIIYRVPVEFLFNAIYKQLREQIRAKELSLVARRQQPLPFPNSHDQHP